MRSSFLRIRFLRAALPWFGALAAASVVVPARAAPLAPPPDRDPAREAERFGLLFRPLPALTGALSPDGKYLAYAVRDKGDTYVNILEVDHPEKLLSRAIVGRDADATPGMTDDREETPFNIRWMKWATPNRLVLETNAVDMFYTDAWHSRSGSIVALDADGKNPKVLLRPRDIAHDRGDSSRLLSHDGWMMPPSSSASDSISQAPAFAPPLDPARPSHPMNVRIFDFAPDDPTALLVRGDSANGDYLLYKLNVQTGALKITYDEVTTRGTSPLLNRQGRASVAIYNTSLASPPYHYLFERRRGLMRWTKLDEIVHTPEDAPGFWVTPGNFFGERSIPLGFADDPDQLYFASNVGRDTYGLYEVNLKSGQRGELAIEDPDFDVAIPQLGGFAEKSALIYDRYTRKLAGITYEAARRTTRWLDPDLQEVQATLESSFRGREVRIEEWDRARNRFLVVVQGWTDAGGIYVFDRGLKKLWEFSRRAPWLDVEKPHEVFEFVFELPSGIPVSGSAIVPRYARLRQVPVIVFCPDHPWERTVSRYRGELRALADMGFVVVQVNPRGANGFGRQARESAIAEGWDLAQSGDIVAAIDELGKTYRIHTQRVALLGEGLGGYLALRTAQRFPDRFRAVVAINPIVDIGAWLAQSRWATRSAQPELLGRFFGDAARLAEAPLVKQRAALTRPTFILSYPGARGQPRSFTFLEAKTFASRLRRTQPRVDFLELEPEFQRNLPAATSAVYRQIEDFLNTTVYDYGVQLGPMEERPASASSGESGPADSAERAP